MAAADYYLCDVCGCKTFYDSSVDYGDRVGEMAVICPECAKTHKIHVRALEQSEGWVSVSERLPDDYGQFLVFGSGFDRDGDAVYRVTEASFMTDEEPQWIPSAEMDYPVTHWRALPSPPSAGEGEVRNG